MLWGCLSSAWEDGGSHQKQENLLEAAGDLRQVQTFTFQKHIILKGYEYLCKAL